MGPHPQDGHDTTSPALTTPRRPSKDRIKTDPKKQKKDKSPPEAKKEAVTTSTVTGKLKKDGRDGQWEKEIGQKAGVRKSNVISPEEETEVKGGRSTEC